MLRKKILVKGKVQGVGFRPFIFTLARKLKIDGFVFNDEAGVVIEIQGIKKILEKFEKLMLVKLPPLAKIDYISINEIKICHKRQFEIIEQNKIRVSPCKTASIIPDTKICSICLLEIHFFNSKYQKYFAINCTNCGPRYTIIQTVPYDRINTSMKKFKLCQSCDEDYNNPSNRRYHAQPTACNNCGPKVTLSIKGIKSETFSYEDVASLIKNGKIGAIKGMGGFHLICDSMNASTINTLRKHKNRPSKPLAIMCKDIEQISSFATLNNEEEKLLTSNIAPIVVLNKSNDYNLSSNIAPNINKIGCLLPYTALHHLLFEYLSIPIIATSANINGEPIITNSKDILKKLPFVDFVVDYNRDILNAVDDSVVQIVNKKLQVLRLSRGYTPKEIITSYKIKKNILALGANSKNSISLYFDNKIITSPYIGDLDDIETFEFFKQTIETFIRFYDFKADVIIYDKHPQYVSTIWAKEHFQVEHFQVQHHLAHIYSCKAEYSLKKDYLGFVFDGTGYGDDKTLWGGEIFVGNNRKYTFKKIKLLGGLKAIKEPRRIALSMLFEKYTLDEISNMNFDLLKTFTNSEINILHQSWAKNLNCPATSSIGRLFDAVSSFANICHYQSYEGETGLLCEVNYDNKCIENFNYKIVNNIIEIEYDFFDTKLISKFMNTLVSIVIDISKVEKMDVILSGGVFQNKTLLELIIKSLDKEQIKYFYQNETSINDGGISLGQIYYYLDKIMNSNS